MKVRSLACGIIGTIFRSKGQAGSPEIQKQALFDFCGGKIINQLGAMLFTNSRGNFQFHNQLIFHDEIGLKYANFNPFIYHRNSWMTFEGKIGLS